MRRILVCEDEDAIRDFIMINLQRAGYQSVGVGSGEEAVRAYHQNGGRFDVAILDVMLPGMDGFEVCKALRQQSQSLGIIMLTAKTQETDKINGLMLGADDYVIKPFSPSELTARIDALCRRIGVSEASEEKSGEQELKSGPFKLDLKSRALYKNDEIIEITGVEFQIMELFMRNPDAALKRSVILKSVWGDSYVGEEKIVDVNIRRVRMKIEKEPSNPEYLQTIWGYGYKWTLPQN
ncbi:MAG: response regulator transcription factor [Oscillospiraceae bacterium]|nr:response regulator transcription factor [Oscillospiraceae bacterium]